MRSTVRGATVPSSGWHGSTTRPVAGGELHLASFDRSGSVRDVALPGWTPVGDEAFELVQRGATVSLVILAHDALSFLGTCT